MYNKLINTLNKLLKRKINDNIFFVFFLINNLVYYAAHDIVLNITNECSRMWHRDGGEEGKS